MSFDIICITLFQVYKMEYIALSHVLLAILLRFYGVVRLDFRSIN